MNNGSSSTDINRDADYILIVALWFIYYIDRMKSEISFLSMDGYFFSAAGGRLTGLFLFRVGTFLLRLPPSAIDFYCRQNVDSSIPEASFSRSFKLPPLAGQS
jgi:hypothetical protein